MLLADEEAYNFISFIESSIILPQPALALLTALASSQQFLDKRTNYLLTSVASPTAALVERGRSY
jgi:hypothetical protein